MAVSQQERFIVLSLNGVLGVHATSPDAVAAATSAVDDPDTDYSVAWVIPVTEVREIS